MKDLDASLKQLRDEYDEPVRDGFTQQVLARLPEKPLEKRSWWHMAVLSRPMTVLVATITAIALGTTVYALGGLQFLNVLFVSRTELSDHTRIVEVKLKNCTVQDTETNQPIKDGSVLYYKVKQESKLSDEEIMAAVQGNCYLAQVLARLETGSAMYGEPEQPTAEGYLHYSATDVTILQITPTSLTVVSQDAVFGGEGAVPDYSVVSSHKYAKIASDVKVTGFDGAAMKWTDLQVGEHVRVLYRSPNPPSASIPTADPSATVIAVEKHPAEIGAAYDFALRNGREYARVDKCTSDPTGYCPLHEEAAFKLPSDVAAYQAKTEAVNAVKKAYEAAIASSSTSSVSKLSAEELQKRIASAPIDTVFCRDTIPPVMTYNVDRITGSIVSVAATGEFEVTGQDVPQPYLTYDVSSHKITSIECKSHAKLYGRLYQK